MKQGHIMAVVLSLLVGGGVYLFVTTSAHAPTPADTTLINPTTMALTLSSTVFEPNAKIPAKYTCDGENINPPLSIEGVPAEAESLVLVMDDPDIPQAVKESRGIESFDHWVLYNLPADTTEIPEGFYGTVGVNSAGQEGYTGPCPPTQYEPTEHRYVFRLYAIKGQLTFVAPPTLAEVEAAAQGSAIAQTELIGRYDRAVGE